MRGINISETGIKKLLVDLPYYFNMRQPILITGPVGIGKSSIIKQFTEDRGLGFSVVYLSQMTSADVRGIPVPEPSIRRMDWYPPACFPLVPSKALLSNLYQKGLQEALVVLENSKPDLLKYEEEAKVFFKLKEVLREGIKQCDLNPALIQIEQYLSQSMIGIRAKDVLSDINLLLHNYYLMGEGRTKELELKFGIKGGVLLLDELLAVTDQAVQIAANQLLLEGLLGDFELMPGWVVWAAGNRGEHGMLATSNAATLDRVTHINLMCNSEEWIQWAREKGISLLITKFLENNPLYFHTGKTREEINQQVVFATPRSWEMVDRFLKEMGGVEKAAVAIEGRLGREVASSFITFATEAENVPSISELMNSNNDAHITQKLSEINKMPSAWGLLSKLEQYIEANKAYKEEEGGREEYKEQMFNLCDKAIHIINLACTLKENNRKDYKEVPWGEVRESIVSYVLNFITREFNSSVLYRSKGTKRSDPLKAFLTKPAITQWRENNLEAQRRIWQQLKLS